MTTAYPGARIGMRRYGKVLAGQLDRAEVKWCTAARLRQNQINAVNGS